MPRKRKAPRGDARAESLVTETMSYVIAMRLIGVALVTLKSERGEAVAALAWEISKRLERLKRILRRAS